ncbi:MAG: hypothetical protein ACTH0V_16910, partial [Microbacteriaceae bacterium]|uniref:hypothetical protein n=1 Tax=unclassified Microbacterium TaxID=2609290 RepID=UPI00097EBD56|nr:hypothetical protein [Microbacterium sp. JB110]RCS57856.1 hypothetical protein CIK77_14600 [Microbacterium sp. JB110]SJM56756.1 hypothetical protein CZ774_08230 [Frigoribacterium sp. JB110]
MSRFNAVELRASSDYQTNMQRHCWPGSSVACEWQTQALEARGFTFATIDGRGRKIRIGGLRFSWLDLAVIAATAALIVAAYTAGAQWPIHRS